MSARPVRLATPMFLPPVAFAEAVGDLDCSTIGKLVLVAGAWWPEGRMPTTKALAKRLDVRRSRVEAVMPALLPFFAADGFFGVMRAAALAKRGRRARAGQKGAAALHGKTGTRGGGSKDGGRTITSAL